MSLQFQRVAVDPFASPGCGGSETFKPLFEPTTPPFKNPHPDVGLRQAEECEVDSEAVVLPGGWARLAEQVIQPLFAVGSQPVDDLGSPWPVQRLARIGPGIFRDQSLGQQVLEGGIQRAIAEGPKGSQQRVEPLAQLVSVHRCLVQDAEHGKLEHASPLATHTRSHLAISAELTSGAPGQLLSMPGTQRRPVSVGPMYRVDTSQRYALPSVRASLRSAYTV